MTDKNPKSLDFSGLGIEPKLMEIIYQLRFTMPTPIQHQSIPITIEGKDLVGIAQTGTGKTLAFAIPIIQASVKFVSSHYYFASNHVLRPGDRVQKIGRVR